MKCVPVTIVLDEEDRIRAVNRIFLNITGYQASELYGKKLTELFYIVYPENRAHYFRVELCQIDLITRKKDQSSLYLSGHFHELEIRNRRFRIFRGYDVTELRHLEKLYRALLAIHSVVVSSKNVRELYNRICRVLVEDLGLRMVWVGEVVNNQVKPVCWHGSQENYICKINTFIDVSHPEVENLITEVIRSGQIFIIPDFRTNPKNEASSKEALRRGYFSSVAIPLTVDNHLRAILTLYSDEPNFFNEKIQPLLEEVRRGLEFAIEKLEKEKFLKITSTALINDPDLIIIVTNKDGVIEYLNPQAELFFSFVNEDLFGKPIDVILEKVESISGLSAINQAFQSGGTFSGLIQIRKRDGEFQHLYIRIFPLEVNGETFTVWIGRDLSLDIALMETLEVVRDYDVLTNTLTLRSALSRAKRVLPFLSNMALAIVIDLYQFTYINETFGISAGDRILIECANRLKDVVGERNLLARTSSDEYLIFAFDFPSNASIVLFIESLKKVFREPFNINGRELILKYNIGISIHPQDGTDPEDLYKKASTACAFAKKEGPNTLKFFESKLELVMQKTIQAENLIEEALEKGYFQFYLQPYFFTNTLSISGAEALVRIRKPSGEIIPPSQFIETLEISPYRRDFDLWAIRTIIKKIDTFKIPIGLNLYPKTFQDEQFWLMVEEDLHSLKHPLILEITERGFIENPEKTINIISYLKKRFPHIKLAIDDFGTGYSNLGYLKKLPVDVIKIDILFVRDIIVGDKERGIVKTIIDLAHILGAKALAEGVETKEHFEILDIMGCDYVQGYFFDKPLPEEEFIKKYLPNLCFRYPQSETQS